MADEEFSFLSHLPLTRKAVHYAERRHRGQRRVADGAPFILHLLEVASLLDRSGYRDEVVAAAVLHDTLEDTDASRRDASSSRIGFHAMGSERYPSARCALDEGMTVSQLVVDRGQARLTGASTGALATEIA